MIKHLLFGKKRVDISTGSNLYTIHIDQNAPLEAGTYHIIAAFDGEYNMGQVFSCTNWTHPDDPVWNDGNDVFDWTTASN